MERLNDISAADLLESALVKAPQQKTVRLAGVNLNLLEWGEAGKPGLLFLHGGAAHVGWWRFIVPFFLPDYHCIAVDISGHGDSERRPHYTSELWRDEVLALVHEKSLFSEVPVIISHSMGGLIAIRAAAVLADQLPGLIIIDTSVRPSVANQASDGNKNISRTGKKRAGANLLGQERIYATRDKAIARFRLIPPQECSNEVLVDYIAAESVRKHKEGWTWKYDPQAFRDLQPVPIFDELKDIESPTAIIYGEHSRILSKDTAINMKNEIKNAMEVIEIEKAHHHIMMDQPVKLINVINGILKEWRF